MSIKFEDKKYFVLNEKFVELKRSLFMVQTHLIGFHSTSLNL